MGRKTKAEANEIKSVVEIPLALVQVGSKLERAQAGFRRIAGAADADTDSLITEARELVNFILQFIAGGADLSETQRHGMAACTTATHSEADYGIYQPALPDVEAVSACVHQAWMDSKRAQGIESRKAEDGEELMVNYDALSEKAKDLDRATVRAVYQAIEAARGRE